MPINTPPVSVRPFLRNQLTRLPCPFLYLPPEWYVFRMADHKRVNMAKRARDSILKVRD